MCGFAGIIDNKYLDRGYDMESVIRRMTDEIKHRGPDDEGTYILQSKGIAFGFRRLSILDLSPAGHQPMCSEDGRYVIMLNGEIYNYLEMKRDLQDAGFVFKGHSDTEVVLASILVGGIEKTVPMLNGMFSLILLDNIKERIYLSRDRAGIKPLYYSVLKESLVFASELKALKLHPFISGDIDREALTLFVRNGYIPAPYSIYEKIKKVMPGTIMEFDLSGRAISEVAYWSPLSSVEDAKKHELISGVDAVDKFEQLLLESVKQRMMSDVPIGAFLSGGIDSSLIVAMMQRASTKPVKTFSIGFENKDYDESEHAELMAKHLKTEHYNLMVTSDMARAVIPDIPALYDEPFADLSQIPTFIVSKMAREHVTVCLSGDGGDELFGGYGRYYDYEEMFRGVDVSRKYKSINWMINHFPDKFLLQLFKVARPFLPLRLRGITAEGLISSFSRLRMGGDSINVAQMYHQLFCHHPKPADDIVLGGREPKWAMNSGLIPDVDMTVIETMMYIDYCSYLPDDIFVKVDRASMAVSLETRMPFVDDFRICEYAWRLPVGMRCKSRKESKYILRSLLSKYAPSSLFDRPKMGFGVPMGDWLSADLEKWADGLLSRDRLVKEGYFKPDIICARWEQHKKGQINWQYFLWPILVFQMWNNSKEC